MDGKKKVLDNAIEKLHVLERRCAMKIQLNCEECGIDDCIARGNNIENDETKMRKYFNSIKITAEQMIANGQDKEQIINEIKLKAGCIAENSRHIADVAMNESEEIIRYLSLRDKG